MWTVALVSVGVLGLWLAPRHWWGWLICLGSEGLWLVYALQRRDHALALMAVVWAVVNGRNAWVAYAASTRNERQT